MRIDVIHPSELGEPEIARWRDLAAADPALANPFLTPGYAMLAGGVRKDARVAVVEDNGAVVAFLAAQRASAFAAMPLGAPLTDTQGLVAAPGTEVDAHALCRALKVGRIDFTGALAHQPLFQGAAKGASGSWIAEVSLGSGAYLAALKERRNDTVRQQDKKRRKVLREVGEIVMTPMSADRADFQQLLRWKQGQCTKTRQPPVWETPWVTAMLDRLWEGEFPGLKPAFFTLHIAGKLAAANFFLSSGAVLHDWLIGHSEEFLAFSPGVMLTRAICEWAGDNGFREVDLGPGEYQYKRQLSTTQRELAWGYLSRTSFSGAVRGAFFGVRGALEAAKLGELSDAPGKAMRRLDVCRGLGVPPWSLAEVA